MWARFRTHFKGFPAQEKVAQIMVLYGLRVHEGHVFCGDIKVSDTAMARATGVDRRVVTATVATIEKTPELRAFFDKLHPVCHLRDVAPLMNWGAIEIIAANPSKPGILAGVATLNAEAGISHSWPTVRPLSPKSSCFQAAQAERRCRGPVRRTVRLLPR